MISLERCSLDGSYDTHNVHPKFGGGRSLMYLDDPGSYQSFSQNSPDGLRYPDVYGKPGTIYEGNLNNSIFALWGDYFNERTDSICDADGCNDFSIRQFWDPVSKVLTIGWYNMKSNIPNQNSNEVNFEVQLNFNTYEFKIVHGNFGENFPELSTNNIFVGFSKDVTANLWEKIFLIAKEIITFNYFFMIATLEHMIPRQIFCQHL